MAIKNRVIIKSRIKLLKRTVLDLVNGAYGAHSDVFESDFQEVVLAIEEGIERQFIKELEIIGRKNRKVVNRLIITIDWQKHKVLCETNSGDIQFDSSKDSIAEQVSKALTKLSTFVRNAVTKDYVNKIVVYFRYRRDVDRRVVNRILGLSEVKGSDVRELEEFKKNTFSVRIVPENLSELSVSFEELREGIDQ